MEIKDKYEELEKLEKLKNDGMLTESEYNKEKAIILDTNYPISNSEKKTENTIFLKLVNFVFVTVLIISAIILSSLIRVIFVEGIWKGLGYTVPAITAFFSFGPLGFVIYLLYTDFKKDKKEKDTKTSIKRHAKLIALYILLILVLAIVSTNVFGGVEQSKTNINENELRAGYIEGCVYAGSTEKHCDCMFDRIMDKYGVDGFVKISNMVKDIPLDINEAEKYITNLARTNNNFRDYAISIQDMSLSCK